jgi:hypothetical protein
MLCNNLVHHAEWHFAECHYAECRYAEYRGGEDCACSKQLILNQEPLTPFT